MTINPYIESLIKLAIKEDIGDGDHTSLACIPEGAQGKAQLFIKEEGVIAGIDIGEYIFETLDSSIQFNRFLNDGDKVTSGAIAFEVAGSVRSLLQSERLVLNVMQRMSGIATQTNVYVEKIKDLKTRILDTRKTTPGMRILDKMAVKIGGGDNHRMGLFDMILIKDNHIDFAGGIPNAIQAARTYLQNTGRNMQIEVEARTLAEVQLILDEGGVDRILLDNFSIEDTKRAVELIDEISHTESSGGITLENLRNYAECGVDFISVGALTHQIKSLDMSLKAAD